MKKFKFFLGGIILLGLLSCEDVRYLEYSIFNASSYNIEIIGYSTRTNQISDTIYIVPDQVAIEERYESGNDADNRTFFSIQHVDSVHVIFDKEKVFIIRKKENSYDSHPLVNPSYRMAAITNDDYNNAIPIE